MKFNNWTTPTESVITRTCGVEAIWIRLLYGVLSDCSCLHQKQKVIAGL